MGVDFSMVDHEYIRGTAIEYEILQRRAEARRRAERRAEQWNALCAFVVRLVRLPTAAMQPPSLHAPPSPPSATPSPTPACPICIATTPLATRVSLTCGHSFCASCVRPYVEMKVRERLVESDQLVCPVTECRRSLSHWDITCVGGDSLLQEYKCTLLRMRDEKNPLARWCPRPECNTLVISRTADCKTFVCPKCSTVGCFTCRRRAHAFAFLCRKSDDDASYEQWERSIPSPTTRQPVRPCPKCRMRIWKNQGCNHMSCTHCHHQYCWVCSADWTSAHLCSPTPRTTHARSRHRSGNHMVDPRVLLACVAVASVCAVLGMVAFPW